jgi:hypothetical protein
LAQSDTFAFIRRYAIEIMLNKKLEAKILNDRNGGQALLDEYRIRVVKHYSVCIPPAHPPHPLAFEG